MVRNYRRLLKRSTELRKSSWKEKINEIEHGPVKWIALSDKFNEWLPVSKFQNIN